MRRVVQKKDARLGMASGRWAIARGALLPASWTLKPGLAMRRQFDRAFKLAAVNWSVNVSAFRRV